MCFRTTWGLDQGTSDVVRIPSNIILWFFQAASLAGQVRYLAVCQHNTKPSHSIKSSCSCTSDTTYPFLMLQNKQCRDVAAKGWTLSVADACFVENNAQSRYNAIVLGLASVADVRERHRWWSKSRPQGWNRHGEVMSIGIVGDRCLLRCQKVDQINSRNSDSAE